MSKLKANTYSLLAYLYFFFNSVGLAGGLLYTNLLTPFFYVWLLVKKKEPILLPLLVVLIPYDIIHAINGIEWKSFLISNGLIISTYIFVCCFWYFIKTTNEIERIFKKLLIANFVFVLIACIVYVTPYKSALWYMNKFTESVEGFYRLSLFTFEASYYAFIFSPIAIYYLLKLFLGLNTKPGIYTFALVAIPLALSLSMGVLACILFSFMALYILNWEKIFYKKNYFNVLFLSLIILVIGGFLVYLFFPNNPIFIRIENILTGADTSARGRTTESFGMAWRVANERSIFFGTGLGQIKILAYDIVKKYYSYWGDIEVVRIPNAVGETLAIFGISGLIIRFSLIFILFFKTKVLSNYYRTALFVFVFTYQFTGSYITNIVEYVIWVMAFSKAFKQFDKPSKKITNFE